MDPLKNYDPKLSEPKWQKFWQENKIFKFKNKSKKPIYSIDTPPPYASADHLHVGHGMHYSQFEFVARYKRMAGFNVFFPMGYDDNGLPTERFVEKKHHLDKSKISRKDFIKLCLEDTKIAGQTYQNLFTRLGFSIDWDLLYHTIGDKARRVAQKSFIDLFQKGRAERIDCPTLWCTSCQTTLAQADLDNLDQTSIFNDLIFKCQDKNLVVSTTRPEMLPACVALFYHPHDQRYQNLKGKFAKVPLFDYEVPILSDENVVIDKGTGLMMVCTFGDKEDVEKWRRYQLPLRIAITEEGRMSQLAEKYSGKKLKEARAEIIADLKSAGLLINQTSISHAVNVHERCGTEIEFLKKAQWQIKVLDKKEELLEIAQKVNWYPLHMKVRYEHWVKNLQWNWGISRQRYYGVPFPVWYCQKCNQVLLPEEKYLPVDPREEPYPGKKCSCGSANIIPEMDVMDTWMTSSCTPEINAGWGSKRERKNFLPMSLRPQAHDIIRTWAFYTLVKSYYHHKNIPWKDIMISGHGQDPHGQKMSKSKGNFIVAQEVIQKYSADAFRYWAASVKLGDDLPYQEKDVLTGQKFVTKLWNASKFSLRHLEDYSYSPRQKPNGVFDTWLLSRLQKVVKESTESFWAYEYSKSKAVVENFFWHTFCDLYLEIVKDRLYNPDRRGAEARKSAQLGVYSGILSVLKMMAPVMPHITEEIYQLYFADAEKSKSVHISNWPEFNQKLVDEKSEEIGNLGVDVINAVRKFKSENKMSMKDEISEIVILGREKEFKPILEDLKAVCRAKEISFSGQADSEIEEFKIKIAVRR